jgi:uncharacterized protein YggU (UPF0235/DUF167 family)
VSAPPADGRANAALVATLAASLGLAKSRVVLLKGQRSRDKLIDLGMDMKAFEEWSLKVPVIGKE